MSMVSSMTFVGAGIQLLLSLGIPIIVLFYLRRNGLLSWKALGVGALVFILFAQVLEAGVHTLMIDKTTMRLKFTDNPYIFAVYGALMAGVFEEVGRYLGFKTLLKKETELKHGLSLGLGHGGIESILIGTLTAVNIIVYAVMINSGTFMSNIPPDQTATMAQIKETLINTPYYMYIVSGLERVMALTAHIGLTMIVFYGIRLKQIRYLFYAILLHALLDMVPALTQIQIVKSVWVAEGFVFIFAIFFGIVAYRIATKFLGESSSS
jgi:uncharacterized membrane protein YhfC